MVSNAISQEGANGRITDQSTALAGVWPLTLAQFLGAPRVAAGANLLVAAGIAVGSAREAVAPEVH